MGLILPVSRSLAKAPNEIFSDSQIKYWFDASDPDRYGQSLSFGGQLRDRRDVPHSIQSPNNATRPWLSAPIGGSVSNINSVRAIAINGNPMILATGGVAIPLFSDYSLWNYPNGVLIIGVFKSSEGFGNTGSSGTTWFSESYSNTLSQRHLHCFRYNQNSAGQCRTSFVFRGVEDGVFEDNVYNPTEAVLISCFVSGPGSLDTSYRTRYGFSKSNLALSKTTNNYTNESVFVDGKPLVVFRIGARGNQTTNWGIAGQFTGVFGELLVISGPVNTPGENLTNLFTATSNTNARMLYNYFADKWKLRSGLYFE